MQLHLVERHSGGDRQQLGSAQIAIHQEPVGGGLGRDHHNDLVDIGRDDFRLAGAVDAGELGITLSNRFHDRLARAQLPIVNPIPNDHVQPLAFQQAHPPPALFFHLGGVAKPSDHEGAHGAPAVDRGL